MSKLKTVIIITVYFSVGLNTRLKAGGYPVNITEFPFVVAVYSRNETAETYFKYKCIGVIYNKVKL